ncbi:MAG: hypothetical protein R2729_25650 [Bryobacteraceae bacterium]
MRTGWLLLIAAAVAAAQDTVFETSVAGEVIVPLTLARITVGVITAKPLDEVLAAIEPAGFERGHLLSSAYYWPHDSASYLTFARVVPADRVPPVLNALSRLPTARGGEYAFAITYQRDAVLRRRAVDAAVSGLFDRGLERLRNAATAAGSTLGTVTRADLDAEGRLSLRAEASVPFTRRTVSVTVLQPVAYTLDEVSIGLDIEAEAGAGMDSITQNLAQAGIASHELTSVVTDNASPSQRIAFALIRPAARANAVISALRTLVVDRPAPWLSLSLTASGRASEAAKTAAQDALTPSAIADARPAAEALAARMSSLLGTVRSVTQSEISVLDAPFRLTVWAPQNVVTTRVEFNVE